MKLLNKGGSDHNVYMRNREMGDEQSDLFEKLPQKITQEILSRTTPADVARLSVVSKSFQWWANSDVVWDTFMPPLHRKRVLDRRGRDCTFNSSKQVFLFLCSEVAENSYSDPLSFRLDKWSGKMCLYVNAGTHKKLAITQLETDYWKKSSYGIPILGHVHWLEVYWKIPTSRLSPETAYEAYLVFALSDYVYYGFHIPIEACVGIPGEESTKELIHLDPRIAESKSNHQYPNPKPREMDELIEVKLGEYFNKEGEDRDVEISLKEMKSGRPKCGVHIVGIEIRPKRIIYL